MNLPPPVRRLDAGTLVAKAARHDVHLDLLEPLAGGEVGAHLVRDQDGQEPVFSATAW